MVNPGLDRLIHQINRSASISEMEKDFLRSSFLLEQRVKNEQLIKQGSTANNLYFILDGYVRVFTLDADGEEITSAIQKPNCFVSSFESFIKREPSKEAVQCISPCELLSITKAKYDQLYDKVKCWSSFCNGIYERIMIEREQRIYSLRKLTASERYKMLFERDPDLVLHTEVRHLASYLGVQPQSLSRIRKNIS